MRGKDYATVHRGGGGLAKRRLKPLELVAAYGIVLLILLLVLAPHVGLGLLSFATIWSFSPLPDAVTLKHYHTVFTESGQYITNTLLYASLAAPARRGDRHGHRLSGAAHQAAGAGNGWTTSRWRRWRCRGVVLGIGYLRSF